MSDPQRVACPACGTWECAACGAKRPYANRFVRQVCPRSSCDSDEGQMHPVHHRPARAWDHREMRFWLATLLTPVYPLDEGPGVDPVGTIHQSAKGIVEWAVYPSDEEPT